MPTIHASFPAATTASTEVLGLLRRLESGGILLGRILRTGPSGNTPVQVGNTLLPLVIGQPLEPGLLVSLRSESGKILVEPQEGQAAVARPASTSPSGQTQPAGTPPPASAAQGTPLAAALTANPILAKVLQIHNLPLGLETLQTLQSVLGNVPPEQGPLLAFLLAKNIPITPENLNLIRERLRARGNLGKELSHLVQEIESFLGQTDIRGADRLGVLLDSLKGLLTWDPTGDLSTRIETLKDFLSTLEQKLLGGGVLRMEGDFKALLMELDRLLEQAEIAKDHPLREAARKILLLLEGGQLTGLSQTPEPDAREWTYWRFPFPGDPHPTTVELAARGDRDPENPDQYDSRNLELLVQVDLSGLGPVRVHLRSTPAQMLLTLLVSETEFHDLLSPEMPGLVEALREQGFAEVVTDIRVERVAEGSLADAIDPLRAMERVWKQDNRSQFDVRL